MAKIKKAKGGWYKKYVHRWDLGSVIRFARLYFPVGICMYMYVYVCICMYMYVYVCICMYIEDKDVYRRKRPLPTSIG